MQKKGRGKKGRAGQGRAGLGRYGRATPASAEGASGHGGSPERFPIAEFLLQEGTGHGEGSVEWRNCSAGEPRQCRLRFSLHEVCHKQQLCRGSLPCRACLGQPLPCSHKVRIAALTSPYFNQWKAPSIATLPSPPLLFPPLPFPCLPSLSFRPLPSPPLPFTPLLFRCRQAGGARRRR